MSGTSPWSGRWSGPRAGYHPYVEPETGAGKGLLEALGRRAVVVVTDDYPAFFLPRMARAAARKVPVLLEAVDSNGLLPVRAPEEGRVFTTAYSFRRNLQKTLPDHLYDFPQEHPLVGDPLPAFQGIPDEMRERWPPTSKPPAVPDEPGPVSYGGGAEEGREVLEAFLERGLGRYADDRNEPDLDVPSGFSPWLHWGHISAHEVFDAVARHEGWNPGRLSVTADGSREGWWGMSPGAEAFLDQLVTWRELGFNGSARMEDWERWESLPDWARETLEEHGSDERPHLYTLEQFRDAETHDELWNAARWKVSVEGYVRRFGG